MQAGQYVAPGQIQFTQVSDPTAENGQVVVQLEKVAVCGSDVVELFQRAADTFPRLPGVSGHECVGRVVTSPVPQFQSGDRVLVIPPEFNAWAEYISADPYWLIPVPDSMTMSQGVLAQLLGCVIWACKKLDNVLHKDVVVIGQGPAGLLFSALLQQMGARRVIGLDVVLHRLAVAQQMGATHIINTAVTDTHEAIQEITQGKMADLVVEAVGKEETINLSTNLLRDLGDMLLFGIPKQDVMSIDVNNVLRRQLRWITTVDTQGEPGLASFRYAMSMIENGRLDVNPLISHTLPFAQLQHAFDLAHTKQDGAVKILVDIST